MSKHHNNVFAKYFLKALCFLVILLAITIATVFITINPVTTLVHKLEEHYPAQVSDIVLNEDDYNSSDDENSGEVYYHYGDKVADISSKDFALNTPVYLGSNRTCVLAGAGLHSKSSQPASGGTSLIVGYCEGAFSPLEYAENGDVITVTTPKGKYNYQISEVSYSSNDKSEYLDLGGDKLVLCALTSEFSAHKGESLFVIADLVGEVQ